MKRIKVFVSYSHKDKKYFDTFMIHLKGLERLYNVTHWIDGEIRAGENIDDTVLKNLNESDIVFILISPNYIQSYYCYEKEMEHAYQRQTEGKCVVIPIIIKETANIDQFEFGKYKMLPVKDLQAYSLQLLEYTKKILDNNIIAIHIRWLKNKCFVSFVDAGYKDNSALSVRALPEDDPMITNAYTLNLPVIKSLNTQLHKKNHKLEGNQRDYITCAFKSIKSKEQAELTLCISCEKTRPIDSQKQLLIMAFCRIDKTIESFLLSYIEACAEIDKRYSLKK